MFTKSNSLNSTTPPCNYKKVLCCLTEIILQFLSIANTIQKTETVLTPYLEWGSVHRFEGKMLRGGLMFSKSPKSSFSLPTQKWVCLFVWIRIFVAETERDVFFSR